MRLLIVDDDLHVIQGIQQNMHWRNLGIDCVFSALGVPAAKKVLTRTPIEIMICDIEMPQETGLDLLEWIRQEKMNIQVIFLTSYAKFEYAQRAIKLDSLEYILKPVDYVQLEKAVDLAVQQATKILQNEVFKENNQYWIQNKQNVAEYFWNGVLSKAIPSDDNLMSRRIEECGLGYIGGSIFLPIAIQLVHGEEQAYIGIAEWMWEFCCQWFSQDENGALIEPEFKTKVTEHVHLILLRARMNTETNELGRQTELFINDFVGALNSQQMYVICGVGMWSTSSLVCDDAACIYTMMYEAPRNLKQTLYLQSYDPVSMVYEVPDLKNWQEMIRAGQIGELKAAVQKYLDILDGQHKISTRNLQQLGLDITQMVYSYLSSMNIYAHMLFDNEENNKMYARAILSSLNMMQYLEYLLSKAMEYKDVVERPHSIADTLRDYMDQHFHENLSRDDLSRLVFLNPDYLSRLFKKERGMSISSYLIHKRIALAKELLATTRTPVSVISSQTGYDNFAYFTKIFKEKTGMSPNEYRKNCQKNRI